MKLSKKTPLYLMTFFLLLPSLVMQGEVSAAKDDFDLDPVNEEIRLAHARELLGKEIENHQASKIDNSLSVSRYIQRTLRERLPEEYRTMAPRITQFLIRECERNQIDPLFVLAVIDIESKFNPLARGRHGEIGLMQIKPSTAEWMAQKNGYPFNGEKSLMNPIQNIRLGIAYISFLRQNLGSSAQRYVNAYNMGPGRLRQMYASNIKPDAYSKRVITAYNEIYNQF